MSGPKGIVKDDSMTVTSTEYIEIRRQHPDRYIRVGDYTLLIDQVCLTCKGMGGWCKYFNEGPWVVCTYCEGHGRRLTPEGETLMACVREWVQ